jgi:predicted nuclease of restriction endonuclease-like (RecB) superfamily
MRPRARELQTHHVSAWEVKDLVALLEAGSNPLEMRPLFEAGYVEGRIRDLLWERERGRPKRVAVICDILLATAPAAQSTALGSPKNAPLLDEDAAMLTVDSSLVAQGAHVPLHAGRRTSSVRAPLRSTCRAGRLRRWRPGHRRLRTVITRTGPGRASRTDVPIAVRGGTSCFPSLIIGGDMKITQSSDQAGDYVALLGELKDRIRAARLRAAVAVNQELVLLYWSIGRDILTRQDAEGWGTQVIDRLSADLRRAFPEMTGLSARNLKYMRTFAEAYPDRAIVQQLVAQLPWGHNVRLVESVKDEAERLWYARQAIEYGWSRNVLVHQIESGLFHRQGKAITNFERTLPSPQSELAQELVKDPYSFDFLALGPEMTERDLERGLLEHLRSLILELGKGFAFVGSQYHLEVGGQDYYLDLLFYHLRLRCFVVLELKIEEFKPEFAGKMNFYLSAVDDKLRHETDGPSIGIILCEGKNAVVVEYALRDSAKPMGVAAYKLSPALPAQLQAELPTVEEFAREFPVMSAIKLRVDVERELRAFLQLRGFETRQVGIGHMLHELQRRGLAPESTQELEAALRAMNEAAHGFEVDPRAAKQAVEVGGRFLDQLRRFGG